jgi:S1-C subfamily serine protease
MKRYSIVGAVVFLFLTSAVSTAAAQAAPPRSAPSQPFFGLRLVQRQDKVVVGSVDPLGLGQRIGLKEGDIVTHFLSKPVSKSDELLNALKRVHPSRDEGKFAFTLQRPDGKSSQKLEIGGKVKMLDEKECKKIKDKFPDSKVQPGTFYIVLDSKR